MQVRLPGRQNMEKIKRTREPASRAKPKGCLNLEIVAIGRWGLVDRTRPVARQCMVSLADAGSYRLKHVCHRRAADEIPELTLVLYLNKTRTLDIRHLYLGRCGASSLATCPQRLRKTEGWMDFQLWIPLRRQDEAHVCGCR